ncbi:hypothetical protein CS557_00520 [Acinetobacter junii]|uniref:hypothetical protein n=1 Tax=Acinetobacter junii TaxID=40215 RepID=UPI000C1B43A8|nr:hypothetical protein [Acinetobacter junii]ATU44057.1 hypothetical protein CS557_00520 [Acinetobacter junii]RSE34031.1 hypothetical protein EGT62_07200 [Acinetobacter junii]
MRNICILIFISALIACSDKNQNKSQVGLNSEQNVIRIEDREKPLLAISESKVTKREFESNDSPKISCSDKNITEWYGFDETTDEPKCKIVQSFKLTSYKCDISKNAFGTDEDAVLLENGSQRIFIYSDQKVCNEVLEIRNSNAP